MDQAPDTALNRICPYFTMFPLRFPYRILRRRATEEDRILDPFCGRGTTNYAARLLGIDNVGIDSSRIAAAIARSKVVSPSPAAILRAYDSALESVARPRDVPSDEFWQRAFDPQTLRLLCRAREALLGDCRSDARIALRALLLGALHGPQPKTGASYLSNQSPRTFAPKPDYALRFWRSRGLFPPVVDVRELVRVRSERYYGAEASGPTGIVIRGDSRRTSLMRRVSGSRFTWVVTSPPYYGMRTYIPDQWIRNWFLGGPDSPDYSTRDQLAHTGPDRFAAELRRVWRNAAGQSAQGARLVIRFGGINDRAADPLEIVKESLVSSGWETTTAVSAGLSSYGQRQADHFGTRQIKQPREEWDVWARRADTLPRLASG